jgi:hypothetical protein
MIIIPQHSAVSQHVVYTLAPLAALGPDALRPDPDSGIKKVCLQELGIGYENLFQEVIVRRASDLYACAAAAGSWYDTLPRGARPLWAVLRFHLEGQSQGCLAEIWPPRILTISPEPAAGAVESWLSARGFALAEEERGMKEG